MAYFTNTYKYLDEWEEFEQSINSGAKYIDTSLWNESKNVTRMLAMVLQSKVLGLGMRQPASLEIIGAALQESDHLKEFRIRRAPELEETEPKELEQTEAKAICLLIKNTTSLEAIEISASSIAGSSHWTEALQINTTLQYLNLNLSLGTNCSIDALAEGLKSNVGLQELRLQHCSLRDDAAYALADALETNNALLTLSLRHNQIEAKGAVALAQSLMNNKSLLILNLGFNWLRKKNEVALAFAQTLGAGGNRTLRRLVLDNSYFQGQAVATLAEVVNVNEVIEELRIRPLYETSGEYRLSVDKMYATLKERSAKRNKLRLEAFENAQGSETTTPWLRSKLMVVGRGAAGKTNLVRSLLGLPFNPEWDSTVGMDLTEIATASGAKWKKAHHKDFVTNFLHQLPVVSPEGPQEVSKQISKKQGDSKQQIPVEDAVRKKSATASQVVPLSKEVVASVPKVGNNKSMFQFREELFMAQEGGNSGVRMSIWDFGGQTVFYTLHHLFLTQYGIYLVVFNLAKMLSNPDEASEYLSFWLNSIKLHAPNAPVFLVGTFLDQLNKEHASSNLQKVARDVRKLCVGFDQVCTFEDQVYCPTSNQDRSGVQLLRSAIERETLEADFVQTLVSLKWMRALDALANVSDNAWMEVVELKDTVKDIGIEREEEVERMLRLFHELGVVLYFSSSVRLKQVVIWKPEWLLEQLSLVIRDGEVHSYDTIKIHEMRLTEDLDCFLQDGIISRDLLEFLWDRDQVDYLLDLMRHLLLLSDWGFLKDQQYLIPSMLSASKSSQAISGVHFYLQFAFLPQGVFERVCCLCVDYSNSSPQAVRPQLYKGACVVDLGDKGLVQIYVEERDKLSVTLTETTKASVILDILLSMMRRIQHDFMHSGLDWQVWVGNNDGFIKHEEAMAQGLSLWKRKKETMKGIVSIDKFLDL